MLVVKRLFKSYIFTVIVLFISCNNNNNSLQSSEPLVVKSIKIKFVDDIYFINDTLVFTSDTLLKQHHYMVFKSYSKTLSEMDSLNNELSNDSNYQNHRGFLIITTYSNGFVKTKGIRSKYAVNYFRTIYHILEKNEKNNNLNHKENLFIVLNMYLPRYKFPKDTSITPFGLDTFLKQP